jgi:alpha-amylase/alpha-mannosidase (GH57 family)
MAKTLSKKQKQILNRYPDVQSVYQLPPGVMTQLESISYFENIESDTERYLNDNFLYHRAQGL